LDACLYWIYLAKSRDRWSAVVNTVMSFGFPQNAGNFLGGWATAGFSKLSWLHGMSYDTGECCQNVSTLFSIHLARAILTTTLWEGLLGVSAPFSAVTLQKFSGAKNISSKICMYISSVNFRLFEAIKQIYSEFQNFHAVRTFPNLCML
jgi:hypothetical protein